MKANKVLVRFGARVRELREARGLSQEALGALANLDRTYISGIERGARNLGLKNVAAIAAALKVPLEKLFEGL